MGNRLANRHIEVEDHATDIVCKDLATHANHLEKCITYFETLLNHTQIPLDKAVQRGDTPGEIRLLTRIKTYEATIQSHQTLIQNLATPIHTSLSQITLADQPGPMLLPKPSRHTIPSSDIPTVV